MRSILIMIFLMTSLPAFADYEQGYAAGESVGMKVSKQMDSSDEINEKFLKPGTSNDTPMKSFESPNPAPDDPGPSEFPIEVTDASTDSFIEIRAFMSNTRDVAGISVDQDTNFDKQYDHHYQAPVASGICVNGLVSCDPGTWENCRFFRWSAPNGRIGMEAAGDISDLEGCYCVNNRCGSNLPLSYVIKDLGAGIIDAVQRGNPNYMITDVESSADSIRYYGRKADVAGEDASAPEVYFSGYSNPEQFYDPEDDSSLTAYANYEKGRQEDDPDSTVYALQRSFDARMNPTESLECAVSRKAWITETGSVEISVNDQCAGFDTAGCVLDRETVCDYNNKNCVTTLYDGQRTSATPASEPVILTDLESGAEWTLYANGSAVVCITDEGATVLESGTEVWWNIRRTYLCDTDKTYGGEHLLTGANTAAKTANEEDRVLTYDEYNPETGTVSNRNVNVPESKSYVECEKGCEVRRYETKTDATADANSWDYQRSVESVSTVYKSCGHVLAYG